MDISGLARLWQLVTEACQKAWQENWQLIVPAVAILVVVLLVDAVDKVSAWFDKRRYERKEKAAEAAKPEYTRGGKNWGYRSHRA